MSNEEPKPCAALEKFWIHFTRNVTQGVCLSETFRQLDDELAGTEIGPAVADVRRRADAGEPMSKAMAQNPDAFGAHVVALVEGGSRAGIVDRVAMLILEHAWRCPECILAYPAQKPRN